MAERDHGREDQLKHHALAVQDMIRQLKGATYTPARGSTGRGGGRGRSRGGPKPGGRMQPQKSRGQRGAVPHHQQRARTARQHRPYNHRHYGQRYGDEYDEYYDYDGYCEEYDIRHHQRHMYKEYPLEEEFDHEEEDLLTPESLVSLLLEFPEFSASLLQLMEQKNLKPVTVRQITLGHPDIFCLSGEKVALKPKTSLCSDYISEKGCESRSDCKNFHICPNYVFGECSETSCFLGHSWNTNHNSKILQTLNLSSVPVSDLQKLLLSCRRSIMKPKETLDVCLPYNSSGCKEENCSKLHVCLSFVVGNTKCHRKDCQLSHDILGGNCKILLEDHGISTNEAPRDITITLRETNPLLAEKLKSLNGSKISRQTSAKKSSRTKQKDTTVDMDFEMSKSRNEDSSSVESGSERVKNKDSQDSASSDSSTYEDPEADVLFDVARMKRNTRNMKSFVNDSSASEDEDAEAYDKDKMKRNTRNKKSLLNDSNTSEEEDAVAYIKDRIKRNARKEKSLMNDSNTSEDENDLPFIEERRKRTPRKEKMPVDENSDSNDEMVTYRKDKYKKKNVKKEKGPKNEGACGSDDQITVGKKVSDKGMQQRTLWSHYLQGDVAVPEICYYSVESMCRDEANVCPRLHATQHFHWQVSEQGNRWLNLRTAQITALEKVFCDVTQDGVDLPKLDPSTVDISVRGLLILMGRDTWHADFKSMTLTDSADSKKLLIRRLCTEAIQGQTIKASTYVWSFLDKNQKWIKYGNVDTTGETNLVSSIMSNDIEKSYLQNPTASVSFNNSRFKYILDFKSMQQTNQKTKVSREVRRRPEPHLEEEGKSAEEVRESGFPASWDLMQPEERMRLVQLTPSSQEYQTIINLLAGKLSTSIVIKIERIQNPFLWRALQNKIKEMTTVYGDAMKVDVRQVFHGTRHDVVSSICVENFDWRLHGSSSGQMYGRGTYFSTDAKYSYNYCRADSSGQKFMFVARVAVGAFTAGSSSMVRPPTNPVTNAPYDSTVDNVSNITILVKYDKQEYYPEYILTLM